MTIWKSTVLSIGFSLVSGTAHADLQGALASYMQGANAIVAQLQTLKGNAGSCGFVGNFVAGRMEGSIRDQKAQITAITGAARQGVSGRSIIEEQLASFEQGNQELRSSSNMIRNGLSTDNAPCKKAAAAFEQLSEQSFALPAKIRRVIDELR